HLRRLHFDLASASDEWREERLFEETIADLGDVDPRFVGRRHRFCFGGLESGRSAPVGPGWVMPNAYARFDVDQRTVARLAMGPDYVLGECRFVPKGPAAREGEGWLVGVGTNLAEARGELIVADAERL